MTASLMASPGQLRHIVQAACLAPSVHNTQPWTFEAASDVLTLRADPTRQLHVLDPDGRQMHLSCGAALFHARTAGRALGLEVRVRLLPDPEDPQRLADLEVRPGRTADAGEVRLATAILHRHTSRGPFQPRPLPAALLDRLRLDAEAEGAILHQVARADDLLELEVLLARADAAQEGDTAYREELAQWVHADGVTVDGLVASDVRTAPGSSLRQRDFTLSHPAASDGSTPPADAPAVVVLTTEQDDPLSWLCGGQALAAVLLRAADYDVQAQPLGQVTDQLATRLQLRGVLGLLSMPQLVLRMGYGGGSTATPRRELDDVLTTVTG